jgi:hypothetical protein
MDAEGIERWLGELKARIPLTEVQRTALKVLCHNREVLELVALEFVHMDELGLWLTHDRASMQSRLDEVVDLNLRWQETYEKVWEPRLRKLEELELAESFRTLSDLIAKLLTAPPQGAYVVTPHGRYFHRRSCKWLNTIPESVLSYIGHEEAVERGYKPCATCGA